jgi:hypothetical protein
MVRAFSILFQQFEFQESAIGEVLPVTPAAVSACCKA